MPSNVSAGSFPRPSTPPAVDLPKTRTPTPTPTSSPVGQDSKQVLSAPIQTPSGRLFARTLQARAEVRKSLASDRMLAGVASYIDQEERLSPERKTALRSSLKSLQENFSSIGPRERMPVYIMEGATGVREANARESTDPDENMALHMIGFLARACNDAAIVALPDAANVRRTMEFLKGIGVHAEVLEEGTERQPGTVYLSDMQSASQMALIAQSTPTGRDVHVLGPPLGHACALLDENATVAIMGSAAKGSGEQEGRLTSLSTNTKMAESAEFIRLALDLGAKQFSSRSMGQAMAVSLKELGYGTDLVTDLDKHHWGSNSRAQFLGLAPHGLMTKRLENSEARMLFDLMFDQDGDIKDDPIELDQDGKGLMFVPLLERLAQAPLRRNGLLSACAKLGQGYQYLLEDGAGERAMEELKAIVGAHFDNAAKNELSAKHGLDRQHPRLASLIAEREFASLFENLDGAHAVHAFAAISLAFQNIYEEKTFDGWEQASPPGQQWRADEFVDAYVNNGKQIPYDALVVMEPFIGISGSEEEKAEIVNKMLLAFWVDLKQDSPA